MKFSSIFLMAATLATITGSTFAAPLHARALEQVDFERDLDVYSRDSESQAGFVLPERDADEPVDDLFARFWPAKHATTTIALGNAVRKSRNAAQIANDVASQIGPLDQKALWRTKSKRHTQAADELEAKYNQHSSAIHSPIPTSLLWKTGVHRWQANQEAARAEQTNRKAEKALAAIGSGHDRNKN